MNEPASLPPPPPAAKAAGKGRQVAAPLLCSLAVCLSAVGVVISCGAPKSSCVVMLSSTKRSYKFPRKCRINSQVLGDSKNKSCYWWCCFYNMSSLPTLHTFSLSLTLFRRSGAVRISTSNRRVWSAQEDEAIRKLVQKHGTSGWTLIADKLAQEYEYNQGRSGKQCWERWHNHLGGSA